MTIIIYIEIDICIPAVYNSFFDNHCKANVFLRYVYIDRINESLISNNVDVLRLAPHTNRKMSML